MEKTVNPPIDLQEVCVRPLEGALEKQQARDFLDAHHYLKDVILQRKMKRSPGWRN